MNKVLLHKYIKRYGDLMFELGSISDKKNVDKVCEEKTKQVRKVITNILGQLGMKRFKVKKLNVKKMKENKSGNKNKSS